MTNSKLLTATAITATIASTALFFAQTAQAAAVAVPLGTAESFSVLAGAGITNTGATVLAGDLGTYPTTSVTGTPAVLGTNHGGDAVTQGAKTDLIAAYNTAAAEGPPIAVTADLGGQSLTTGVYNSASTMGLTGQLTLDANGDPSAVWVFQVGSGLTTASASSIILVDGALACNVYWQIGSSATLGTNSTFVGTLIALTDISLTTGATVQGRMLARNGAVTMDTNTITKPGCGGGSGDADADADGGDADADSDGSNGDSDSDSDGSNGDSDSDSDGSNGDSDSDSDGSNNGNSGSGSQGSEAEAGPQIADVPSGAVDTGRGEVAANNQLTASALLIMMGLGGIVTAVAYGRRTD